MYKETTNGYIIYENRQNKLFFDQASTQWDRSVVINTLFAQDWPNLLWGRFNNVGVDSKYFTRYGTKA